MLHVQLETTYYDNEKIIAAGERAEVLWVRGLCVAKEILTDGFLSDVHLKRLLLPGWKKRADTLCKVGLWERDDDRGGYWIVGWLDRHRSAEEVKALSRKRSDAGRKGGKQSAEARSKQRAQPIDRDRDRDISTSTGVVVDECFAHACRRTADDEADVFSASIANRDAWVAKRTMTLLEKKLDLALANPGATEDELVALIKGQPRLRAVRPSCANRDCIQGWDYSLEEPCGSCGAVGGAA